MGLHTNPTLASRRASHRSAGQVRPTSRGIDQCLGLENIGLRFYYERACALYGLDRALLAGIDCALDARSPQGSIQIKTRNARGGRIDLRANLRPIGEYPALSNSRRSGDQLVIFRR